MCLKKNGQRIVFLLVLCGFTWFVQVYRTEYAGRRSRCLDVDTVEGVRIEIKAGSLSPHGAEIVFYNDTERRDYYTGVYCQIERKRWNRWYRVPYIIKIEGPFSELTMSRPIPTHSAIEAGFVPGRDYHPDSDFSWSRCPPNELCFDWTLEHGELPPGDYRLLMEVLSEYDEYDEDYHPRYLSAPFTIS